MKQCEACYRWYSPDESAPNRKNYLCSRNCQLMFRKYGKVKCKSCDGKRWKLKNQIVCDYCHQTECLPMLLTDGGKSN